MADEDGWFHEKAFITAIFGVAFAACHKFCPFFHADFDIVQDFFLLGTINLGAQLGIRVCRIPDPDMFKGVFQVADKFIKDAFLDKETGTGTADLALIEEDALAGTVNGLLKVSVIKNDIRRFTAKFQGHRNQFVTSGLIDAVADFCGTGKGQLIKVRMIQEPLTAAGTFAGNEVHDPFGQDAVNEAKQFQQGQRGMGRRLNDNRIACSKSRCKLPAGHGKGEVPRDDLTDDTYRFMENKGHGVVVKHGGRAFPCAQAARKITEVIRA